MDWSAIVILGAYHGINPGMGWLFAVALGMQQRDARGVWRALPPMAVGHAAAVGVVIAVAALVKMILPLEVVKLLVASTLITLGVYRLWRHRHPRYGGMQVGFRDLAVWSFLMASAHGAGFMVLPFMMGAAVGVSAHAGGHAHLASSPDARIGAIAVALHSLAYLAVTASIAWIVYRRLGLAILRTAWFNLDWLWAAALVVTGAFVLLT